MDIKNELNDKGYIFIPKWNPESSIEDLAKSLGHVTQVSEMFGHDKIPNIQKLFPKKTSDSLKNQYSGYYGLNEFPLHTDLAHWSIPPKILMLRCIKGFKEVSTKILPLKLIYNELSQKGIRRAVVSPRQRMQKSEICLLPLLFGGKKEQGIRWDSLFLVPQNEQAKIIKKTIEAKEVVEKAVDYKLIDSGDTLILNNHVNLHGRSSVPNECCEREIERIYIN
ncbi:MAG: hypothetical protein AB2792_09480 [Candidatus Thiodiazotropha sp.]